MALAGLPHRELTMTRKHLSLIVAVLVLVAFWILGLRYLSAPITIIVGGSMAVGLLFWLRYLYGRPAEPMVILPPFLVMMAALSAHKMEEYYAGFPQAISALFGVHFTLQTFLLVFEQVGPMLYFLVILGLFLRDEFANFFACFLMIGMGLGEVTHFIFPLIAGGPYRYFPGMYTAILPIATGAWTILSVMRGSRHRNASPSHPEARS
jgi:hypothetical protein